MVSEDERCRLAVNELKRLSSLQHSVLKPNQFKRVAKQAKIDERTLYSYIKERDIII